MIRRTKKKKLHDNFETRRWEPWTEEENYRFFESLERNSRNWGEIAKDIGTKKQEQVRLNVPFCALYIMIRPTLWSNALLLQIFLLCLMKPFYFPAPYILFNHKYD